MALIIQMRNLQTRSALRKWTLGFGTLESLGNLRRPYFMWFVVFCSSAYEN